MTNSIPLSELESSASAKFENIGDKYVGTITAIKQQQQTDLDGKPKFWPSGDPAMLWVITIQPPDGDAVALWAKGGRWTPKTGTGEAMLSAIASAAREVGAESIDVGGKLAVAHSGLGEAKAGMSPPKLYTAQYEPPKPQSASVPVSDLFSS